MPIVLILAEAKVILSMANFNSFQQLSFCNESEKAVKEITYLYSW